MLHHPYDQTYHATNLNTKIIVILMSRHDDAMTNPLSSDCNPFHESRHCLLHTSLQVPVTS